MNQTTWITIPGWLEVIDSATGLPLHINITYISAIAPAAEEGHTTIYAAQTQGKTTVDVAEPYSSVQSRLQTRLELQQPTASRW